MAPSKLPLLSIALALTFAFPQLILPAADFSPEATALPFPPDAKNLEFTAWSGDIKYTSQSPLKSLAAFYLKEMPARGWDHDESAAEIDDDSIELKFTNGKIIVEIRFSQWSKEVRVSLDCEKLQFNGVDDPAKLAAAGLPVPRAVLFVQKELTLPAGAIDLRYTGEGCMFKSPLPLTEAFDYFMKQASGKGFRESRRPILSNDRRYTEFKKGATELSVNIFTDAVGSRIILEYKDNTRETPVPPLAAVASLPIKGGPAAAATAAGDLSAAPTGTTPIDVTTNKGSAVVNYAGKQYTFSNVACFLTKNRANAPQVVFSSKPIPYQKMQSLIATNKDFSFGDLYDFGTPDKLIVQLGDYLNFQFSLPSTGISHSVDNAVNEMKTEGDRVRGTLKMPPKEVFRGEQFSFTATVDAVIITPTTRITGPGDPVAKSDSPVVADAPIPFPDGVENASSEGSKFRKTYKALVRKPPAEVAAFYRQELGPKGWVQPLSDPTGNTMQLKNDSQELFLTLKPQRDKTEIELLSRDIALAKKEGIIAEPGKARLMLGNANNVAATFTVANTNYSVKPDPSAKDPKQAVNVSLPPGTYTVSIRIPGQPPQTEKIDLTAGSTWALIALPMGGCFPVQLY